MRKKLISKTYLRDVKKYTMKLYFENDEYYIAVKKIIDIKEPFILPDGRCLIGNGYYIVEVIPIKDNYTMRVFLNEQKEILEYYFDISKGNGIDEETKIPYYDDLYLDVTYRNNSTVNTLDENELEEALNNNKITDEEYYLAITTKDKLIESIKNKTNKLMKLDLGKYLV